MDTAVKNMNKVASEQSDNYKRSMKKEYLVSTRLAFQNKIINFQQIQFQISTIKLLFLALLFFFGLIGRRLKKKLNRNIVRRLEKHSNNSVWRRVITQLQMFRSEMRKGYFGQMEIGKFHFRGGSAGVIFHFLFFEPFPY